MCTGTQTACEEQVVLVLAAAELLVDPLLGVAVEAGDGLDQRVGGQPGGRGELGQRRRGHPRPGLEVRSGVALGHRDRGQAAVLAGVEDVPGRDPLGRLGHLPAEPVVGQALVGVPLPGLVDHQPAAEAERERPAAVRLLEPGAEPAEGTEVGRGAERDRGPDRLAGVATARRHRPGNVTGHAVVAAHLLVALEATGRQQHAAPRADLDRSLGRHRGDADHARVLGDQSRDREAGPDRAALADQDRGQPGDQSLPAAERATTTLAGAVAFDRRPDQVGNLGREVGALDVGGLDRAPERDPPGGVVVLRERQPLEVEVRVVLELGHQSGRRLEERLDQLLVGALEDRREVVASALRRVRDPGPLLDLAARQPAGAAGVCRRAADEWGLLDQAHRQPGLGRQRGAGERAAARPDHDHVVQLCHRAMVATRTCSRQAV